MTTSVRVYYADVSVLEDEALYSAAFSLASEKRKKRILKYPSGADRRLSLAAELLLKKALSDENILCSDLHYEYGEYGKPFLKGLPEFHFSISHSGSYAVTAVSDSNIGCDIERIRPMNLSVARRFFHPDEYAHIRSVSAQEQTDLFFRYWTLKESFLKVTGKGLRLPMNAFRIDLSGSDIQLTQSIDQKNYHFHEPVLCEGYRFALCSEENITAGLFCEDLGTLTDRLSGRFL